MLEVPAPPMAVTPVRPALPGALLVPKSRTSGDPVNQVSTPRTGPTTPLPGGRFEDALRHGRLAAMLGGMVRRRPPPQPVPRPLRQVLRDAVRADQDGWLCLPAGEASTLETDAFFWSAFGEEGTAEEDTVEVNGRRFQATLDGTTVHDICTGAAALEDPQSDEVLLEALTYYFEHDAFLPERGYEPPPWDEIQRNLDLEFWEALGEEEAGTKCRREGCEDGTIRHSVLCRRHHFESIRNRPSPF